MFRWPSHRFRRLTDFPMLKITINLRTKGIGEEMKPGMQVRMIKCTSSPQQTTPAPSKTVIRSRFRELCRSILIIR